MQYLLHAESLVTTDQPIFNQSQLAAVQGGPGEPRVLIEADPENPGGGLRYVILGGFSQGRE